MTIYVTYSNNKTILTTSSRKEAISSINEFPEPRKSEAIMEIKLGSVNVSIKGDMKYCLQVFDSIPNALK